jgi:hypothetical protein
MMIKLTVVLAVIASALGFNLEMKAGKMSRKYRQNGTNQPLPRRFVDVDAEL